MRTLELLRALSDRELAQTDNLVKAQKRKSLQLIYALLKKYRKRDGIPTNEELYLHTFEQEYSSSKNYLLRHELRLLNEIIYNYLIEDTFTAKSKKHKSTYYLWLARSFFDRKLHHAFETDIDRFIDYAREYVLPEDTAQMLDLKSLWMIYTQQKTVANVKQQIEAAEQWKQEHIRHFKYRLREIEARTAYLQMTLRNIDGENNHHPDDLRTLGQTVIDLSAATGTDAYEDYLVLKKHSFQTRGLKRIEVLRQMLAYEESEKYKSIYDSHNSQIASLNGIAMEYILIGDFAEADTYLTMAIERCEKNNQPLMAALPQNYIGNQLNLKAYQKGIDFYEKYETQIANNRQYVAICIYKSYCHLFLGEADEALSSLPQHGDLTAQQNLMVRMIYLIAFTIRQQFDLAENECRNITRLVRAKEGLHFDNYDFINSLFLKYIAALAIEPRQRSTGIANLKEELKLNNDKVEPLAITEFAMRWLVEQVGRK